MINLKMLPIILAACLSVSLSDGMESGDGFYITELSPMDTDE